jgi:putative DNA primase/helicase
MSGGILASTNIKSPPGAGIDAAGASPAVAVLPTPDAARFLDLLCEAEEVTFQTFDDKGKRRQLAEIRHGYLDDLLPWMRAANERGAGIFWCPQYTDGKGRTANNVIGVRALLLDLDGPPLQPVIDCGLDPHAVVESSPGKYHVYFAVADCSRERFRPLQKAMAARFGGDPSICDLPRVLRVPGFLHQKAEPFVSRLVSLGAFQPYPVETVIRRLGLEVDAEPATAPGTAQGTPPGNAPASSGAAAVFVDGQRTRAMLSLAGKLRRNGLSADALESALLKTNAERCSPPLPDDKVKGMARSVGRYAAGQINPATEWQGDDSADAAPGGRAWPLPYLPGTSRVPEISATYLGGWAGRMASTVAASTQTPEAMAVMSVLAVLAAVLQRRFEVLPYGSGTDYREPLSLWTMVVLGSGNRKTAVHAAVTAVLVDWEKRQRDRLRRDIARVYAQREVTAKRIETLKHQAGKEEDASKRQLIQDEISRLQEEMPAELHAPRLFSGDVTNERLQQLLVEQDERIAIMTDEGGFFSTMAGAYSGGMGSFDVHLQGHAGSALRVDRAGRLAHIDRPALTYGVALQPDILQDTGKVKRFRGSGLMARFLYAVPKSTVGRRNVREHVPLDNDARVNYEREVDKLLDNVPCPVGAPTLLPFSAAASERWLDLCEFIEKHQGEGGRYAHMVDWTSKLPGAAARIAGLLAIADRGIDVLEIPLDAVERAVRLAHALIPHAEAAFSLMGAADAEGDAQAVLSYLMRHRPDSVVRRDLQKAMEGRFRSLERLLAAIKLLQEWHVLGHESKTTGAGRPSIYYPVNPLLFVDEQLSSDEGN